MDDLGIESLTMFELCSEIESRTGLDITAEVNDELTVGRLLELVKI